MSAQDFGANDWLVDEMYEQYLQDPSSVDPAWVEYFKTNKPGSPVAQTSSAPQSSGNKGVPPIPKAQQQAAGPAPVAQPAPVAAAPVAHRPAAGLAHGLPGSGGGVHGAAGPTRSCRHQIPGAPGTPPCFGQAPGPGCRVG